MLAKTFDVPMLYRVHTQQTTIAVQRLLDELNRADDHPVAPLVRNVLERSATRLHWLCGLMLERQYPRLMNGPLNLSSDELLGGVVERLMKAMRKVRPETVPQFFALANRHMRWELNDFARRLDIEGNSPEFHDSQHLAPSSSTATSTSSNARRILEAIEALVEDEREVFTLVRIQGVTRAEAAEIIGVAEKTVQRRLKRALIRLHHALQDMNPIHNAASPAAAIPNSSELPN